MKEKCAIIGYYCINNQEKCVPDCINSLKNLQHRGRESSGISYLNNNNECMLDIKCSLPLVSVNLVGKLSHCPLGILPWSVIEPFSLSGGNPSKSQLSHCIHLSVSST